ncbi:MAG: 16S rRNA (uracil(1498)-N(3))-methyltransferase [Bacteroidia bacterium]|nr:16S rRNA (uracil(1498)-N(3))-methyltransferase [Bacteroidia bacterium]
MELYFTNSINENYFTLIDDDFRHCTKVLRNALGDEVNATDGCGKLFTGFIYSISKNELTVKINETKFFENEERFNLAIAPTKNAERIEWLIEKSVEIGIKSISFIICEHSERKKINIERLNKIAISAMKQSNKYWLPKIYEPVNFKTIIKQNPKSYIAHCYESATMFFKPDIANEECMILIGPEGDFSKSEVKFAIENNCIEVSLGKSRLRTETAGFFACNIYKILNQIK